MGKSTISPEPQARENQFPPPPATHATIRAHRSTCCCAYCRGPGDLRQLRPLRMQGDRPKTSATRGAAIPTSAAMFTLTRGRWRPRFGIEAGGGRGYNALTIAHHSAIPPIVERGVTGVTADLHCVALVTSRRRPSIRHEATPKWIVIKIDRGADPAAGATPPRLPIRSPRPTDVSTRLLRNMNPSVVRAAAIGQSKRGAPSC